MITATLTLTRIASRLAARAALWLLVALMVAVLIGLQAKAALAIAPKAVSIIERDMILVGDVFDGIPADKAAQVLGPAPKPGKDMVLNARTLMRLASALNIKWLPKTAAEQVTIRRAGLEIGASELTKLVAEKLEAKGITQTDTLTLTALPDLVLPASTENGVELISIAYNPADHSFQGEVAAPSAANPIKRGMIAGTINRTLTIPVLKEAASKGAVIGAADLDFITVPEKTLQNQWVTDADALIGMTPRRTLTPGKPIAATDLDAPMLVKRGETITLVYAAGGINLATTAKALQDGRKGEMIRIMNISSNTSLAGIVTGDRQVLAQ